MFAALVPISALKGNGCDALVKEIFKALPEAGERAIQVSGRVKWFDTAKGYGFIAPDDGGKDVFVHISAVERAGLKGLNDNQKIGYELQSGRDGRASASDLKLL